MKTKKTTKLEDMDDLALLVEGDIISVSFKDYSGRVVVVNPDGPILIRQKISRESGGIKEYRVKDGKSSLKVNEGTLFGKEISPHDVTWHNHRDYYSRCKKVLDSTGLYLDL